MSVSKQTQISETIEVPVLIVGGGPAGLALACELGWRGVKCLLVEMRDGSITQPKMNQVGVRTMEFCRRWGVARKVRTQSIPEDFPRNITFVTAAGPCGHELARYEFPSRKETPLVFSPEALQRCSQLRFDPILRNRAAEFPEASLRLKARLESFEQDDHGVVATIEDLSMERRFRVRADYMVGCDGAESRVRKILGIRFVDEQVLGCNLNVFFRSTETATLFPRGRALMQWIFGPKGMWGDLVAVDGGELWRLSIIGVEPGAEITKEQADDYIRLAVGSDFIFESLLPILPWTRRSAVAECFSRGRVFLCGDAAHQMSPTGGFGMNTGIQESVDLGWKLAAVIQGWGGPCLLDSYHIERRPVAKRAVDEGAHNYFQFLKLPSGPEILDGSPAGALLRTRIGEAIRAEHFEREYAMTGIALGYRYEESPIVVPDGTEAPPDDPMVYVPTARPGHRAPHAWISDDRSTLDHFGRGFTLLRLGAAPVAVDGLIQAASQRWLPLSVIDIPDVNVYALYQRRLVLVRPDGHVAWRGDSLPSEPGKVIDAVRGA